MSISYGFASEVDTRSATGDKKHRLRYRGSLNSAISYWRQKTSAPLPRLSQQRDRVLEKTGTRLTRTLNSAIAYWKKHELALPGLSTARSRTTPDKI